MQALAEVPALVGRGQGRLRLLPRPPALTMRAQ
jgi:hypothetical protein